MVILVVILITILRPGLSNVFYEDGIILASPNVYVSFFLWGRGDHFIMFA